MEAFQLKEAAIQQVRKEGRLIAWMGVQRWKLAARVRLPPGQRKSRTASGLMKRPGTYQHHQELALF